MSSLYVSLNNRSEPAEESVCSYHRFFFIGRLTLTDNIFTGTLSPLITLLSSLSECCVCSLACCHCLQTVPSSNLLVLKTAELEISTNDLNGFITTEFQVFTDIKNLDLSNNRFSGDFTTMFAGLNNLGKLHNTLHILISRKDFLPHTCYFVLCRKSAFGKQPNNRNYSV